MNDEKLPDERERIATLAATCVSNGLRKTSRVVSSFYDELLSSTGLHANQIVMLVVPYLAGPVSINKMAEKLSLDRTTLVRNLKLIQERGFVTVKPGQDLRTRIVTLTPQGREMLVGALPLWEAAQRQAIDLLGTQHRALVESLELLNALEHTS